VIGEFVVFRIRTIAGSEKDVVALSKIPVAANACVGVTVLFATQEDTVESVKVVTPPCVI
jgi:hypothetical protein